MSKLLNEEENMRSFWKSCYEEFETPAEVQQLQATFLKHHLYQWTETPPLGEYAWMSVYNKYNGSFSTPTLVFISKNWNDPQEDGGEYMSPTSDVLYSIQPTPERPKP